MQVTAPNVIGSTRFEALLAQMEGARAPDAVQQALLGLRDLFGLGHADYRSLSNGQTVFVFNTHPRVFLRRYSEAGYHDHDPVVRGCLSTSRPMDWTQLDWSAPAAQALRALGGRHGIGGHGISMPLRGAQGQPAVFSVSKSGTGEHWRSFLHEHRKSLILVAQILNQKTFEFDTPRAPATARALSPREAEAMALLARGFSRDQAAWQLSISPNTLRDHIDSARGKLGALNTVQAVAQAVHRGLIML